MKSLNRPLATNDLKERVPNMRNFQEKKHKNPQLSLLIALFSLLICHAILLIKESNMPQAQTMTLDEKLAISCKAAELWQAGDKEGYSRTIRTVPMPPYLAKIYKEKVGVEQLIESGWNLSEAEAEFGPGWLSQ
jgi:hypothetical protein